MTKRTFSNLTAMAVLFSTVVSEARIILSSPTPLKVVANTNPGPAPGPSGKPTGANTGWQPTGVALTLSAGMNITTSGTVVDSRDFTGPITIQASNVTIRRSRVRTTGAYFPIRIISGTNILIEDVEVDGGGFSSKGIHIEGGSVTLRRINLHDSEDGIHMSGSGPIVLENSYIHSPRHASSGHSDGLEIEAVSNVTILNNNLDYAGANTSATMIDNYFGAITNLVFEGNWLSGGAYNMYIDGNFNSSLISKLRIRNNRWIRNSAQYGPLIARGALSSICWEGNVYDDNGQVLNYDGPSQVSCQTTN